MGIEKLNDTTYKNISKDNPKDLVEVIYGDDKDLTKFQPQQKVQRCKICNKVLSGRNKSFCNTSCRNKRIVWNKGVTGYSTSRKGFKMPEETKEKLRIAHLGKIPSIEQRKKQSDALKGKIPKNLHLLDNSGAKSHWWKGGITTKNELDRKQKEYRLWRKFCFERDIFTCQKHKTRGGKLNAHHINNFSDYPELRFSVDNGITLSEKAHKEFHKIYGTKNNTQYQLQEFLCSN